jgi:hypothetical protein
MHHAFIKRYGIVMFGIWHALTKRTGTSKILKCRAPIRSKFSHQSDGSRELEPCRTRTFSSLELDPHSISLKKGVFFLLSHLQALDHHWLTFQKNFVPYEQELVATVPQSMLMCVTSLRV